LYAINLKEGFGHYPDQNMPFKGENKWEGSGRLDLNGLDIRGLKGMN